MTLVHACIALLAMAVLLGSARYLRTLWRSEKSMRPKGWRVLAIVSLQISSAALLYFVLFPPPTFTSAERLVILTANADTKAPNISGRLLALPEAPQTGNAERVPDLASALRRYPGVNSLQIIGDGLSIRDQEAARGLSIEFIPSPLPRGLVELNLPDTISSGARWSLQGRINQISNARVELLDPGNIVTASTPVDADGDFMLADTARTAGLAMYQLRITDGNNDKEIVESIKLPITIVHGQALKVLSLSGGPNPELKYLRRWAIDAGVELESQINLSPGMQIRNAAITINATSLREVDLLILDERAWGTMNRNSKQSVIDALRAGMGLLLRITGPLTSTDRNELRVLGFSVNDANLVQGVRLENGADKKLQPSLTRRPLRVSSSDAVTLLRDDAKNPLALWRAEGRGRIGLIWLTDSYKLVLNADSSRHGQIWQKAVSTIARTRNETPISLRDRNARINERIVLCNMAAKAYVQEPGADITYLSSDDSITANKNCAAFWPRVSGWHNIVTDKNELPFYVRDNQDAIGLKASAIREATLLLAAKQSKGKNSSRISVPGSPWPWFSFWLLVTVALWWLERSRLGKRTT